MAKQREQLGNLWTKVNSSTVNKKLLSKLILIVSKWAKERTQKKCLWAEKNEKASNKVVWTDTQTLFLKTTSSWTLWGVNNLCSSRQQWKNGCRCSLPSLAKNVPCLDLFPVLKSCTGKEQDNLAKKFKWKYGFHEVFMKKISSWNKDSPVNILDVPCHWGNWRGLCLTDHEEEMKFLGKTTQEKWVSRHYTQVILPCVETIRGLK